ncbi:MAG: OmpA family protein [Gammaproteobacteria bacterium]|nr:OmpA family protein [Gammaproteobacteria bacterium]
MRSLIFIVFAFTSTVIFSTENQNLLRIHGSNTIGASLTPKLAQSWLHDKGYTKQTIEKNKPGEQTIIAENKLGDKISVEIHSHGSSTGFADLATGKTDIGMSSRPIKPQELKNLASLGPLDQPNSEYIIALDGLSIIIHPDNPLQSVSKQALGKIFSGEIRNWSKLGPKRGKIQVYALDENSGTYDIFAALVLGNELQLAAKARRYESNTELSEAVSSDPNAIGFVGLAYVLKSKWLAISEEGTDPVLPMPFDVSTEDYVLSRRLYLYVPPLSQHPLAAEFAKFSISQTAQHLVDDIGFVSQNILTRQTDVKENAPDEYKMLTGNAKRLSLNIRFRAGYTALDNKAIHDVKRIVSYMSKPENRDRKLMLLGFADTSEALPYLSLSLSITRADAVADYFIQNGLEPFKTRGFGQELPVASNKTAHGRRNNRRVEVWLE